MKKCLIVLSLLIMTAVLTGCSVFLYLQASGRDYGETREYAMDEIMQTAFFDFQINEAKLVREVAGYYPGDDAHQFLILNVTVTNTYEDYGKISMFYGDFELTWDALEDAVIYAEEAFSEGQLPDEYDIFKKESRTGDLIFIVPGDVTEFSITYAEYWGDDFVGNTHIMNFSADPHSDNSNTSL